MILNIKKRSFARVLPYAIGCMVIFFMASASYASELDKTIDTDTDGLTDYEEINIYGTDHTKADTDGDGHSDFEEVSKGYSPRHAESVKLCEIDSNGDKVPDCWEIRLGLNVLVSDNDGDGYSDWDEIVNGYNPKSLDKNKVAKKIEVSIPNQELAYYFNGIELERYSISGGRLGYPTPKGNFTVLAKQENKHYGGTGYNFYYPNTKWNLHFTTKYYRYWIHGAYWHKNFGKPMSSGCVNVAYPQMERLYNFAEVGTPITIY
jgi:hypothetical protein